MSQILPQGLLDILIIINDQILTNKYFCTDEIPCQLYFNLSIQISSITLKKSLFSIFFIIISMSVLFVLSNVAVPFLILVYTSLVNVHKNGSFLSAKWFLLIIYTLLSNILFYFFSESGLFLILDLVLKLGIVFIPQVINNSLEKIIAALHLEIVVNLVRGIIMPKIQMQLAYVILFAHTRMYADQRAQFKSIVTGIFENSDRLTLAQPIHQHAIKKQKKCQNIGIGCDILTVGMLNEEKRQKQILKLQLAHQSKTQSFHSKKTDQLQSVSSKKSKMEEQYQSIGQMKKKSGFQIQKSSTDIGIVQQQDFQINNFRKKQQQKQQAISHRKNFKSLEIKPKQSKQESQPSMILNKLDVSQYSDMFQDEPQQEGKEKLIAKVQTIIQIAGINTARLQIYNIELYSNSQIRIVSLYGRQFERHKLLSMHAMKHGYYQLKLEGGKVQSRKVKFRGPFEKFLKYLQTDS